MLISWILFTIPIWILGVALFVNKEKRDYPDAAWASAILVLPIWWGIYFLIAK
jgi:hypothetical protein